MSVTMRPRASLGRILEDLGTTLLDVVFGTADHEAVVDTVVIHDALDDTMPMRGALVLGVGITGDDDALDLIHSMREQNAIALVLRAPVHLGEAAMTALSAAEIPVLALTRGASWAQLAAMVRSMIAEGDLSDRDTPTLGGLPAGDLFALANAISTLVDAPVTIEDRNSRVLAFSGRQDEADGPRIETILGRQVPERYMRQLEDRGVFQSLYRSEDPILVEPVGAGDSPSFPRVAHAVRAGDEILGSIWAAVQQPLSTDRLRAFKDAAKLVALHMLQIRAGADVERRLRADLLATVLEGGAGAADAASRLRLQDHTCVVIAIAPSEHTTEGADTPDARDVAERQRLADALGMHLGAVYQRSAVAPIGNLVYAIVGVKTGAENADVSAERVINDFVDRLGLTGPMLVGIGTVATDLTVIPRSRRDADRALRVLAQQRPDGAVARFDAVQMDALLVELGDVARAHGDRATGPVAALLEHDREKGTQLVETLSAWLDAFGDVTTAAAQVYTHPNTFRYRLRRLSEISGLDLTDPDARFSAMVQLRLLRGERA